MEAKAAGVGLSMWNRGDAFISSRRTWTVGPKLSYNSVGSFVCVFVPVYVINNASHRLHFWKH